MPIKCSLFDGISKETIESIIPLEVVTLGKNPEVIFVRSNSLSEGDLPKSIFAICRAGAGTDNIPMDWCTKNGIVVFNAPGANANSVKELVICSIIAAARNLPDILELVSKKRGYSQEILKARREEFRGNEIFGKTLGIVGVGAIGKMVAKSATDLGMKVVGYDPYSKDENFQGIRRVRTLGELSDCDFITLHCNATKETRGLINEELISKFKKGVIILNFGREELVDKRALKTALKTGRVRKYITDFHDPDLRFNFPDQVVTLVHAGALTEEAEQNAQEIVARQFLNFWSTGEIENSVNFPSCKPKARGESCRFVVSNFNAPGMIRRISQVIADSGYNVCRMLDESPTGGELGYNIIDIDNPDHDIDKAVKNISLIPGVTKVRLIK